MPELSAEEVARFVALGRRGKDLLRAGEVEPAAAAFREQILICSLNYEPHVSLALLEAGRGREAAAVEHLHAAVVRGFLELRELFRSEAWTTMGRPIKVLKLVDALPRLAEIERSWPGWGRAIRSPNSVETVVLRRQRYLDRIDAMSPALGPRLTGLWHRQIDQAAASALDAYVREHPDADDLEDAVTRLVTFLGGGPLQHWDRLPAEPSRRLIHVSEIVLQRFPESDVRPTALVAFAVGKNAVRDKKTNALHPGAAEKIRTALEEVVREHSDSPLLPTAVVGLVRTHFETGNDELAGKLYSDFLSRHEQDRRLVDRVRDDLGMLALQIAGLPEFHATTLDGGMVDRDRLAGKIAVIDFWATWCGPCLEEFPSLRRIDERYGDDVVLLGVNLNDTDELPLDGLREWIAVRELPGEQIHDGLGWDSELVRSFGVKEIPFNVVVGPDGAVLAVNRHGKQLERTVRGAVKTASAR